MHSMFRRAAAGTRIRSARARPAVVVQLLRKYEEHLVRVCGLAPGTVQGRLLYAADLLRRLRVRHLRQLHGWSPVQMARYVSSIGRRYSPVSAQGVASSIRSFLRFLLLYGLIQHDLAAAVPSFAHWRLASLPTSVRRAELEKLLRSVDLSTPIGKRDLAILLCMIDLGLRGADVADLRQDGVDLAAGILRFRRTKQREQVAVPMTRRLADAIRLYLREGRPLCDAAGLFIVERDPFDVPITRIGICCMVARRAARAGLGDRIRGTHILRRTLATEMINSGASLKEIADLLGHRSIDTTSIYAKVDLRSLVRVALPWPVRQEVIP
jgi:integrase/recombinase XerD